MDAQKHWNDIYTAKGEDQVSWFAPRLDLSIELIGARGGIGSRVLDVGGGASTLVDDLLRKSYTHLSVLDLSETALQASKKRLGLRADLVTWISDNILKIELPENSVDIWHDRAVFHFFCEETQRQQYIRLLHDALAPDGSVIIGTFGPDGPERCSGLPIVRYSPETLSEELGSRFKLVSSLADTHTTPFGTSQQFNWSIFERS